MRIFSAFFKNAIERCNGSWNGYLPSYVNPFVGKPLGYTFFREKKLGKHRLYYLIYEEYVAVFVVALSDKKTQQKSIEAIKSVLPQYYAEIQKLIFSK